MIIYTENRPICSYFALNDLYFRFGNIMREASFSFTIFSHRDVCCFFLEEIEVVRRYKRNLLTITESIHTFVWYYYKKRSQQLFSHIIFRMSSQPSHPSRILHKLACCTGKCQQKLNARLFFRKSSSVFKFYHRDNLQ